jgi:hypothetical protein
VYTRLSTELPRIDLTSLDASAASLRRLILHFNPNANASAELPSLAHNLMSTLTVGFFRYTRSGAGRNASPSKALLQQKYVRTRSG